MSKNESPPQEDVWIPSVCMMCYSQCAIRVHRVNGVAVKIEGNPDSPQSCGRLCPKGLSGLMLLYDPNRVNKPLKRTNPEKGIGVDPKWVEITWDEALDTITEKLKKVRAEDPRKFVYQGTTIVTPVLRMGMYFAAAFGSPNTATSGGSLHCGNGAHEIGGLMHSSWSVVPDFEYCNYAIYFGASKGHSAGHVANNTAQKASDARARGMKLVVVDPMCNFASAKATEWVPIRPGTDAAMVLAMVNILLNELGIYDAPYLKKWTNAPYLIQPDGQYYRDPATRKPVMWDHADNTAKVYDDPTLKDPALAGSYSVNNLTCQPAFQLIREHVKKYTPEKAEEISSVPAATIRRIAGEFGEAAQVGSTIVIDGKELPYRPAAAVFFRGAQGHKNSLFNCVAFGLLNHIVGAADVPGGCLGFGSTTYGYPATGHPYAVPSVAEDGLMNPGYWFTPHVPYPPVLPEHPQSLGLKELFPLAVATPIIHSHQQQDLWKKFNIDYRPEVMMNMGANGIMCIGNPESVAESLKIIPFIFSFSLYLNEFTDFCDMVLPDASYLERYFPSSTWPFMFGHPGGPGEWSWATEQPVVEPVPQRRDFLDVILELVYRIGGDMPAKYHALINKYYDLQGPFKLQPDARYTWKEICDHVLKCEFGAGHGLEWFGKNGVIKWPKKVEEAYWRTFTAARVPVYFEFFKSIGKRAKEIAEPVGLKLDYRYYEALPEWLPCISHEQPADYDLFAFYYRDVLHTDSSTQQNPWLDEASRMNRYTYTISINSDTARSKSIGDGDVICLESSRGRKVRGRARLTQCIHPEGVSVTSSAGHWSPFMPIARGKGVHFDTLMEVEMDYFSPINLNMDTCVKVKVYKEK